VAQRAQDGFDTHFLRQFDAFRHTAGSFQISS
jgi:hypothetical protein